jgi:hypothetical protein
MPTLVTINPDFVDDDVFFDSEQELDDVVLDGYDGEDDEDEE